MLSTTQTSNYVALASLIVIILEKFGVSIPAETIVTAIAGAIALFAIVTSILNRYQKGDIDLAGRYL